MVVFGSLLEMLESNPQPDLTSVALRCWWDVKVGLLDAAHVLEGGTVFRREKDSIARLCISTGFECS